MTYDNKMQRALSFFNHKHKYCCMTLAQIKILFVSNLIKLELLKTNINYKSIYNCTHKFCFI